MVFYFDSTLVNSQFAKDTIFKLAAEYAIIEGSTWSLDSLIDFYEDEIVLTGYADFEDLVSEHSPTQTIANLKLDFLEYLYTSQDNITSIIDTCKAWENDVDNDNSYSAEEKIDFLKYMAVFRYSLVYWYDVGMDLRSDVPYKFRRKLSDDTWDPIGNLTEAQHDANWKKTHPRESELILSVISWIYATTDDISDLWDDFCDWVEDLF